MTLSRPATIAACVGGASLALDAILIAALNSSAGLADNALWLIGLAGTILSSSLVVRDLTQRLQGTRRALAAVTLALSLIAVSAFGLMILDSLGAHITRANRGVHDELGTFLLGLTWLAAGVHGARAEIGRIGRAVAMVLGGLLAALGFASTGQAAPTNLPTIPVALTGTQVTMPTQLPTGAIQIAATVGGSAPDRTLSFVRLDPGVTLAQALGQVARHHGDLDYLQGYASIVLDAQVDRGHASADVSLTPGSYVAVDTTAANPAHWPSANFTVTATGPAAALPAPAVTLSMIDFAFRGPSLLREGALIRYVNDGFVSHMALGLQVANAAAARTVSADLKAGDDRAAEKLVRQTYSFVGALSPGGVQEQPLITPPGVYVLGCFMSTQDGREHTRLGMVRTITVVR